MCVCAPCAHKGGEKKKRDENPVDVGGTDRRRRDEGNPRGTGTRAPPSHRAAENVFKDNKSSPKQLITSRLFVCVASRKFRPRAPGKWHCRKQKRVCIAEYMPTGRSRVKRSEKWFPIVETITKTKTFLRECKTSECVVCVLYIVRREMFSIIRIF